MDKSQKHAEWEKAAYRKAKSEAMVTEIDEQMTKALIVRGQ